MSGLNGPLSGGVTVETSYSNATVPCSGHQSNASKGGTRNVVAARTDGLPMNCVTLCVPTSDARRAASKTAQADIDNWHRRQRFGSDGQREALLQNLIEYC
jgi:hypothetical protein